MKSVSKKIGSIIMGGVTFGLLLPGISAPALTSTLSRAQATDTPEDTISWQPPRFSEREEERHKMVREGIEQQGVTDPEVLEAMRQVPRHLFVPEKYQQFAYQNRPLPIGYDQTISQPYIVGYMTRMLDLDSSKKVLEIGTGSGYQAAVLAELTPRVFTIEIVEALGKQARRLFDKLGYDTIETKIGDGYRGWPEHAPFDAIILTAAPEKIPPPLIEQLKPGGILVAPLGAAGQTQTLTKVTKNKEGDVEIERQLPVRFVPMTRQNRHPQ
ncbi:protein-L-isoaspartate(D-aspartate) O-methyltransferase [Fodinibius roseus]|uniref:Protein-L-isoaspartate O-methyltransferase n=1 Tax=Fodinibius roseus TaxID=1194090 RepID=A0A1M5CTQ9_9BACT|nr:protein-L-isoaspartate(D-aspartate) O-methyltransferase [Fodinibius roseus]SHF57712.1 protein-L-isoaspartate(D-aspartate) O-methyltransferase [Fodinibius roseus]